MPCNFSRLHHISGFVRPDFGPELLCAGSEFQEIGDSRSNIQWLALKNLGRKSCSSIIGPSSTLAVSATKLQAVFLSVRFFR